MYIIEHSNKKEMEKITIEVPEGKEAKWVNNVLMLVDKEVEKQTPKTEFKVGEILQFGLLKLQCVEVSESLSCDGCLLKGSIGFCLDFFTKALGTCDQGRRTDGKSVIFVKIEES